MTKFWIDDIRPAPPGWTHIHSVNEFIELWKKDPNLDLEIDTISLDHDAGDYFKFGGDYIRCLDYMTSVFETRSDDIWNYGIKYHLHSANPVGVANMRRIIQRNGWTEVHSIE